MMSYTAGVSSSVYRDWQKCGKPTKTDMGKLSGIVKARGVFQGPLGNWREAASCPELVAPGHLSKPVTGVVSEPASERCDQQVGKETHLATPSRVRGTAGSMEGTAIQMATTSVNSRRGEEKVVNLVAPKKEVRDIMGNGSVLANQLNPRRGPHCERSEKFSIMLCNILLTFEWSRGAECPEIVPARANGQSERRIVPHPETGDRREKAQHTCPGGGSAQNQNGRSVLPSGRSRPSAEGNSPGGIVSQERVGGRLVKRGKPADQRAASTSNWAGKPVCSGTPLKMAASKATGD